MKPTSRHITSAGLLTRLILTFEIFDFEKVGQGHELQHWQCRRQITSVKIYKRHFLQF